ncbi:MAG: PilN domain-containing protein [Phycisphaerales bacterium]
MALLPSGQSSASPAQASFLPGDYIARKAAFRNNIITCALFVMVMGSTVGAFVVTHIQWRGLKARYNEVTQACEAEKKKLTQLDTLRAQRAEMMEKAQITASLVERVPRWAVLGELDFRMPMSMRIDELALKGTRTEVRAPAAAPKVKTLSGTVAKSKGKGGKDDVPEKPKVTAPTFSYALTVTGTAIENNDVADYIASLKQSPVLKSVELTYIKDEKFQDTVLRKYEIVAALRTDVDQKALAASLEQLVQQRTATVKAMQAGEGHAQAPEAGPFSNAEGELPVEMIDLTKGGN